MRHVSSFTWQERGAAEGRATAHPVVDERARLVPAEGRAAEHLEVGRAEEFEQASAGRPRQPAQHGMSQGSAGRHAQLADGAGVVRSGAVRRAQEVLQRAAGEKRSVRGVGERRRAGEQDGR